MTLTAPGTWAELRQTSRSPLKATIAQRIVEAAVNTLPIQVTFPSGRVLGKGGPGSPEMLIVRPEAFYTRLGKDFKIGFGEAYMAGDWTCGEGTDLADLMGPFASRLSNLFPKALVKLRAVVDRRLPTAQINTLEGSRDNIQAHYDLSNNLFEGFLDPTMSYSSAWWVDATGAEAPRLTLEEAQLRKIDGILDQAAVTEGSRVLEIGSGWGALAIRAAGRGATVVSVTLSKEQLELAQQRADAAGVSDRIEFRLQDYREVTGAFDSIVSVEMIEAVGEEFWPTYFQTIDSLLAPGGRVSIQAITMGHERMMATRRSYGWIQKYIFPGGLIPSLQAIDDTLAEHTSLHVSARSELGPHYARTLQLWRERFNANWSQINSHGFDETFRRMWEFYLGYCEAGFRTGYLGVSQLQMTRKPTFS